MASAPTLLAAHAPRRAALSLDDERELRRFFNDAGSAYGGLRSTFGVQIERLAAGIVTNHGYADAWALHEEIADRIDRNREHRRMALRLQLCGQRNANALERVFTLELYTGDRHHIEVRFGRLAPLAEAIHSRALDAAADQARAHVAVLEPSGGLATTARGVAMVAARAARDAASILLDACRRAAHGGAAPADTRMLAELEVRAERRLDDASTAYLHAKGARR